MKTKAQLSIIAIVILFLAGCAEKDDLVTITTDFGEMKVILFDETPLHKETFLEMANSGKYDSTIFHRVMKDFMIQGGDINQKPGNTEPENTLITPEFRDNLIHTKGMLAGARQPDNVNPGKKSGTQFYIVQGTKYNAIELQQLNKDTYYSTCVAKLNQIFQKGEQRDLLNKLIELQKNNDLQAVEETVYASVPIIEAAFGEIPQKTYTDEQYKAYETIGGTPFLDGEYTVYGQVIDGMEIIDMIADQSTDGANKPTKDIYMTVSVEKMAKSKISKLYEYTYPSE